jgi:hypothetical protein
MYLFARHQWLTPIIPATEGGRDQEDHGSKPTGQIVRETLARKNASQKKGLVV